MASMDGEAAATLQKSGMMTCSAVLAAVGDICLDVPQNHHAITPWIAWSMTVKWGFWMEGTELKETKMEEPTDNSQESRCFHLCYRIA